MVVNESNEKIHPINSLETISNTARRSGLPVAGQNGIHKSEGRPYARAKQSPQGIDLTP